MLHAPQQPSFPSTNLMMYNMFPQIVCYLLRVRLIFVFAPHKLVLEGLIHCFAYLYVLSGFLCLLFSV